MSLSFYRAFEEKFRGSRELIRSRLEVYLPFVRPLLAQYPSGHVVDLGCGRGEWLELLRDEGFDAQGVDLDDGMLEACRSIGLSVHTGDAVSFLSKLPDESQVVVSAFHLVEHISFEVLQQLVKESLRVLMPGGLLILETPNPENLLVGACGFYMDPTHQRPIPPPLLAFVPEYIGFKRTKVLRLQESKNCSDGTVVGLLTVIDGVSPDYAVVAQKTGCQDVFLKLDAVFDKSYGITLPELAGRYQMQVEARIAQAEARVAQAESHIGDLINSSSWRITAPLRSAMSVWRRIREKLS